MTEAEAQTCLMDAYKRIKETPENRRVSWVWALARAQMCISDAYKRLEGDIERIRARDGDGFYLFGSSNGTAFSCRCDLSGLFQWKLDDECVRLD